MPVSVPTNAVAGTIGAGNNTLTLNNYTFESGKTAYALVLAETILASGGEANFDVSATWNGVAMDQKVSYYTVTNQIMRAWVFTLEGQAGATANFIFDGSALAAAGYNRISGVIFSIEDCGVGGPVILPGGFGEDSSTGYNKKVYGWSNGGMQITAAWGRSGAGIAVAEGTNFASTTGLSVNYQASTNTNMTMTVSRSVADRLGIFSFNIPPIDDPVDEGSLQPIFTGQFSAASLAVGSFGCTGFPYANAIKTATAQHRQGNVAIMAGTLKSMRVKATSDPGADVIRCELIRGCYEGSAAGGEGILYPNPTGIYVDIDTTNWEGVSLDSIDLPFYKYEQLGFKVTHLSGSGSISTTLKATLIAKAGSGNDQIYGGGSQELGSPSLNVAFRQGPLHPYSGNWTSFPTSQKSLVGIAGTVEELLVAYQVDTQLSTDYQYYLEVTRWNEATQNYDAAQLQDGTGGSVDTEATLISDTANRAYARSTFSLHLNPKDLISVVGYLRNASSAALRHAATIRFVPDVPGTFMLSGHSVITSGVDFVAQFNSARDNWNNILSTEDSLSNPIPPLTAAGTPLKVEGLVFLLESAGPGLGKSWSLYVNRNLVNTLINLVLSDTTFIGEVDGDEDFVEGDLLSAYFDAINLPFAARQFWSIPGLLAPENTGIIIVRKDAGGNTSEDFEITATGLTPSPFTISGEEEQVFSDVPAGSGYGFEETDLPDGWQLESVTVSNGSPVDNITVAAGETVIVTFYNTLINPANNPSGLYELIPGKTNDTIWVDVDLGITEDVKIP